MSKSSTTSEAHDRNPSDDAKEGGKQDIRWEEIATTSGITSAQIIAGRLQSEGIPAQAWQESAGQSVGLVVGLLGIGHVIVPVEYVDQAFDILDSDNDIDEEE